MENNINLNSEKLVFLADPEIKNDIRLLRKIDEISKLDFVEKIVCLPDVHFKGRVEAPSSFAAATMDMIVPHLTSPSLNCGMGVLKTSLKKEDITEEFLERFYENIDLTFRDFIFFRKRSVAKRYRYSSQEFLSALLNGAETILQKYSLSREFIKNMEAPFIPIDLDVATEIIEDRKNLYKYIPRQAMGDEPYGLGRGFHGNHFLEFQHIEEICDKKAAIKFGIKKGDVVVMYHGGGGIVPYFVGRYFARRMKNSRFQRLKLFFRKFCFHFCSTEGLKNFRLRWHLYFSDSKFPAISLDSQEGKRMYNAFNMSMNYGYAYRAVMAKMIADKIKESSQNAREIRFQILGDKAHNIIQKEAIGKKNLIVHRHNACRILSGKPLILSGFNSTSSYLMLGGKNSAFSLGTLDHGAGETIDKFAENGISKILIPEISTLLYSPYTKNSKCLKKVSHITDEGINHVVDTLSRHKIAQPLARLRPIAVLKHER